MSAATDTERREIDDLRDELGRVLDLRDRAFGRLHGPMTLATTRAARLVTRCDVRVDQLKRQIRTHPDYVLEGL